MASSKEYLNFILDQLSELDGISSRAMMGEYIIYYKGKVIGGIYDDRFLVKPTESALVLMPSISYETPYEGAKDMLLVNELDDRAFLAELLSAVYNELPEPKSRKKAPIIQAKFFDELTTKELYEIIKARMQIFVVEQKCVYQDLDDVDYKALHIFCTDKNGKVTACMRAFRLDDAPNTVRIGRVLTIKHGKGLGGKMLHEALRLIKERMNPERIYVESQTHAIGFYEREGFNVCTDEFLDVGIPHRGMELYV